MMRAFVTGVFILMWMIVCAQKADYKDGYIRSGGENLARVERTKDKETAGLTSTFEVYSMSGEKLIIATYASEFEEDEGNNMNAFYRFTFLTADQIGIFALSKLGTEKSFGKLLAGSGIFKDDGVDASALREFIAKKGRAPKVAVGYSTVARDRSWPVRLREDKTIEQNNLIIGGFRDVTAGRAGIDSYEFSLPTGVVVATVSFTGGNNAQNCEVHTLRDNHKRIVPIPSDHTITASASSIDRNQWTLDRIVKWLVENQYL